MGARRPLLIRRLNQKCFDPVRKDSLSSRLCHSNRSLSDWNECLPIR